MLQCRTRLGSIAKQTKCANARLCNDFCFRFRFALGFALCRCVCDLAVGSLAFQDPPSSAHGVHVTFSAKKELSGWQAPAAASEEEEQSQFTAAGTRPRLFVVFEDGSGYEVLDLDLFTAYAQRKVRHRICPCQQPMHEICFGPGNSNMLGISFCT